MSCPTPDCTAECQEVHDTPARREHDCRNQEEDVAEAELDAMMAEGRPVVIVGCACNTWAGLSTADWRPDGHHVRCREAGCA